MRRLRLADSSMLLNNDSGRVASLAVNDQCKVDAAGALQFGNQNHIDLIQSNDISLRSGKLNRQPEDTPILCVGLDND